MARILFAALLLLFTLPAAAQTPGDSIAFVTADWHTTDLGRGAACRYAQVEMFGSRQSISVVSYPARHFATQIVQLDGKGETTGRMGEAADATAAINGSYFNMKTFTPITFVMVDCRVLGRTTPGELMRTNGIIAIRDKQGHDVAIFACDTTQYPRIARRYRAALAAGPLLVSGGKIIEYDSGDSFYTHRHPRSLIGKRPNGEVVMAVIDGRAKGQAAGATIAETAYIARLLGLTDALNLDGGGSSALWTAQEGVVSHPSDNRRFDHAGERAVPNGIVAVRGNKGAVLKRCPAQPPPANITKKTAPLIRRAVCISTANLFTDHFGHPLRNHGGRHGIQAAVIPVTARLVPEDRTGTAFHIGLQDAARVATIAEEPQPGMGSTPYRHYGRRHKRGHVHDERIHRHHAVQVGNQV